VELLLGRYRAERAAFHEEHHGDEALPKTVGTVRSIREVTCRRQPRADGALVPIPSSGVVKEVEVADKWAPEPPEELRRLMTFDGWIVELEISRAVVERLGETTTTPSVSEALWVRSFVGRAGRNAGSPDAGQVRHVDQTNADP